MRLLRSVNWPSQGANEREALQPANKRVQPTLRTAGDAAELEIAPSQKQVARETEEMLSYKPANPEQHEEFLQLMLVDAASYLDYSLKLMRLTWQEFANLTRRVGQVYAVYQDESLVGFYWIEERGRILHLHGLFVKHSFQGKGIGTQVLNMLANKYASSMEAIELGVHDSNPGARSLYERLGFKTVKRLADLGFSVMQKPLSGQASENPASPMPSSQRGTTQPSDGEST